MGTIESGGVLLSDPFGTPDEVPKSVSNVDNEVTYILPTSRKLPKTVKILDEEEPLIDTTEILPKKSKKTERAMKRLEKKLQKESSRPKATSLVDLPPELLQHILGFLRPSDIFRCQRISRTLQDFVGQHENAIARDIIHRRYWVLSRCFQLPVALRDVDPKAYPALLSQRRQDVMTIHRRPYQHIKSSDPLKVCTCMHCVLSWNNLCLILDLAYWQRNLDDREPIPMISRGTSPEWNQTLIERNAGIVERAMDGHLLYYATILEKHLRTTMSTLSRTFRGKKTVHPKRLYHFTNADAQKETDEFLERGGPHSYEFPWHRDNYYALEAYVPNRKWSKENEKWVYYAGDLHERDLKWTMDRWTPGNHEGSYARLWKDLVREDEPVDEILKKTSALFVRD